MLHLMKLAVGIRDLAHLNEMQARRARVDPPLRHLTRHRPRQAADVLNGGSIYWVIGGMMVARQRLLDIRPEIDRNGTERAALVLDPTLVPLIARPIKPFQGWRYLQPAAAPPDLDSASRVFGEEAFPPALLRELRTLGLL